MKFGRAVIAVRSLTPVGAAERLAREGIMIFSVRKEGKNLVRMEVARKDLEKIFAILRGSCYNVEKVYDRGIAHFCKKCLASAGFLAGAAFFAIAVSFCESRVMRIDVVGSGAYYKAQVLEILSRNGVAAFSARPQDTSGISAQILALPRVSYCGVSHEGGILTVEVGVSDENVVPDHAPLCAPVSGTIEELVVVRGTPLFKEGEEVRTGETVVGDYAVYGETQLPVVVIARVTVAFPVRAEYGGTEAEANGAAYLEYGEISGRKTERTPNGWLVTGTARRTAASNL